MLNCPLYSFQPFFNHSLPSILVSLNPQVYKACKQKGHCAKDTAALMKSSSSRGGVGHATSCWSKSKNWISPCCGCACSSAHSCASPGAGAGAGATCWWICGSCCWSCASTTSSGLIYTSRSGRWCIWAQSCSTLEVTASTRPTLSLIIAIYSIAAVIFDSIRVVTSTTLMYSSTISSRSTRIIYVLLQNLFIYPILANTVWSTWVTSDSQEKYQRQHKSSHDLICYKILKQ